MNIRKMNMQVGFVTFVMVTLAIPANAEIGERRLKRIPWQRWQQPEILADL